MLNHPTLEALSRLKLHGMTQALTEQLELRNAEHLTFEERLAFLTDREATFRDNRRYTARLRKARLRQQATLEDLDTRHPRGLDHSLIRSLANCRWITEHRHISITGPTGVGKTYLACALAHQAIRFDHTARYARTSRLLQELTLAKGDGRYLKLMGDLAKTTLIILDDFAMEPLTNQERHILLEILDDRYERGSTLISSQLPTNLWHDYLGDRTLADAILDRFMHNSYRLELNGESMRKTKAKTPTQNPEQA